LVLAKSRIGLALIDFEMEAPPPRLCDICKQVNFGAIFTPREWDPETGRYSAIYRPEYAGTGGTPLLREDWGNRKRNHAFGYDLPQIRTADYDDLSESTDAEHEEIQNDGPLEPPATADSPTDTSPVQHPEEVNPTLAAELSDMEDDDGNPDAADEDDADEDESEEDDSVSTWSENSHFLDFHRVDIEKQAQGQWDYTHGLFYYLGTIWDLRKRRRECDLCWRLWRNTRKNPHVKTLHLTKSRCILKLLELKGKRTDGSGKEVTMLNMIYLYAYKIDDPRGYNWIIKVPFVIQGTHRDIVDIETRTSPNQIIPFEDRLFGEARRRSAECNYACFREWLRLCETKHHHKILGFSGNMNIRLIDVQQNCLIERNEPSLKTPRFVALSYVWGKAKQKVMLTKSQLETFKEPGFFSKLDLDQTVQDAMEVVLKMNERYLWIDSLCIIQDDPVDQAMQIPQMHQIYGKAILTIVAAWGNHADAGLHGVGGRGRGRSCGFRLELEDIRVTFRGTTKLYWSPEPMDGDIGFRENYLHAFTYKSRAWTYQEAYLSTRALIFGKEHVYFECEKCTWCEETHWESDAIDFISWRALKSPMPDDVWADHFARQAYDRQRGDAEGRPSEPRSTSFAAIVKEYSSRELSYSADALNACSGVLAAIKQREQSDFLFGLRTRFLGNDLLFNPTDAVPRRSYDKSLRSTFPSWSWVSWHGPIEIANEPRNNSHDLVENVVLCDGVKCYTLEENQDGTRTLQIINASGGWRFQPNYVRLGEGIYGPEDLHRVERPSAVMPLQPTSDDDSGSDVDGNPITREEPVAKEGSNQDSECEVDGDDTAEDIVDRSAELNIAVSVLGNTPRGHNPSEVGVGSSGTLTIPEYPQDITLPELRCHPAFSQVVPKIHIMFRTFSSLVLLRTEYDEWSMRLGGLMMAGTKKHRRDGIMGENRDDVQRNLYILKKKLEGDEPVQKHTHASDDSEDHTCPCCGEDDLPTGAPGGFELGPYAGRLPPFSRSWSPREYHARVPDGVYRLAYMNNNQLPMFGHLLIQPVSRPRRDAGYDWDGEIMERVSGALGPLDIHLWVQQEKYCAKWGTIILG
jgi:Heterokaryon incompatibility protein (HET)